MKLSRNWLREFVDLSIEECDDRAFSEAMTLSGSKVEVTEDLGAEIRNVVVGRVLSMERHPDSDHMWVCQIDVGRDESVQIVTGAWNIHVGDLVPAALHNSLLPGGKKITKGKLRGVMSDGMLCSLKELGLTAHDYPYGEIKAAALLNDYHPIDPEKPSVSPEIKPGDKLFGKVVCAGVGKLDSAGDGKWLCSLSWTHELDGTSAPTGSAIVTDCQNLHTGDLVAYDISREQICTLADLRAEQREFPHCIDDGIFVLREPCKPGDDIRPVLGLDDHVVEFEITPNRPDCLCTIGLAREAAVTFGKELKLHEPVVKAEAGGDVNELAKVIIEEPELCLRYTARMVRNVKIEPSPEWMRRRIRAAGMRPINNIVDITNYVMLEYGQPMHAFDFACVDGGEVHVRRARAGETIQTLDGNDRALSENMLCICDTHKPVGVAGVMGGANSEIVGNTAMVLFESANFNGASIRRTATALGMRTDASSRYEKGLDPANTLKAVQRACELVELLGAGEVVGGIIDVAPSEIKQTTVKLEPEKVNALLGTDIDGGTMRKILLDLGFGLDGDTVLVPSWRGDVEHNADIAEEVARFFGYNNIPTAFSGGGVSCGAYSESQQFQRLLGGVCRSLGLDEIISFSFTSPSCFDKIRLPEDSPLRNTLKILNPLGEDTSIMRTSALPSMLEVLARNYNYRSKAARLYEMGKVYFKRADGLADEPTVLSLGAYGEDVDFFTLKGWVELLLNSARVSGRVRFVAEHDNPSYHPGRCAVVYIGQVRAGVLGQVHPLVCENYGVDRELYCAELSFDALFEKRAGRPVYKPLPRFPSTARDLSVVVASAVTVASLRDTIVANGGKYLRSADFVDVYTGAPIASGLKSVTFSLTLGSDEQTLTDEHADEAMAAILHALKSSHGAVIR
ncbi:MAG: phenylalanine--tRNA ligase subunit beta [Butyricicoccus sp.]|nr:phenylalanine--tRNA ligase subunit beta [Butyricicoccus sp.]